MNCSIRSNNKAVTALTETMVALGITTIILTAFLFSVSNLHTIYTDRSDLDLQDMCTDICEKLTTSPGLSNDYSFNWEDNIGNIKALGLGATTLTDYGFYDAETDTMTSLGIEQGLPATCFLKGTQVLMADGSYQNIEDIAINDYVMTYNFETHQTKQHQVTNVFHHASDEMTDYYLVINEYLKVTPNHKLYRDNQWVSFGDISIGDMIGEISITSIKKVFEQEPTYDLEIEKNHNYYVKLGNDAIIAHNEFTVPQINPSPWILTSKNINPTDTSFSPYGGDYDVTYTQIDPENPEQGDFIYEIKDQTNFLYAVIDSKKIDALLELDYEYAKDKIGLDDEKYNGYNFNIVIKNSEGTIISYGEDFNDASPLSSRSKNILIFYGPQLSDEEILPPSYVQGQITVRLFLN